MKKLLMALCLSILCSVSAFAEGDIFITFSGGGNAYLGGGPPVVPPPTIPPPRQIYYYSSPIVFFSAPVATMVTIDVYNSSGALVYSTTELVHEGSNVTINTDNWEPGTYTLCITKPDGASQLFSITV